MKKSIQIALFAIIVILIGISYLFIQKNDKDVILVNTDGQSPIELIGGSGERIYLRFGIIYADKNDPNKEYEVVDGVFHVTSERYKQLVFFDTPEEAEAAGYKPSKTFAKDYECVKQGKDFLECNGASWDYPSTTENSE